MHHDLPAHFGRTLTEGKTKRIIEKNDDPSRVILLAKDDITAGDGAKHDIIPDKGKIATQTTCNVFRLLQSCQLPVAFDEQGGPDWFSAPKCEMLPYEVVTRREAHGSFLKRAPHLHKGHIFPKLIVEFFLKTKDRRWHEHELTCDDPYMIWNHGAGTISLYHPATPFATQAPFLVLQDSEVFSHPGESSCFGEMSRLARQTFLVLEKAWQLQGRKLVDMKVEFGLDPAGKLLLADVIDNDSWRVIEDGAYIDKQIYRDGGQLSEVVRSYQLVERLTSQFVLPRQRVILWAGSLSDNLAPLVDAIDRIGRGGIPSVTIACSVHKEPVRSLQELARLTQEVPDTVVIAYIGMSNGAGPTLAAATSVPVITVPAGFEKFPDDVWSALRAPSKVPVMTVLNPANAALAALGILALRNPQLHACLRYEIEERTTNVAVLE
ncbi:MAG: AIR carboxylase family protein [Verrucomicrobia bacterium]|nr:AIR carboxylase family protein [Verrucomicrobiota bacterium]